MGAKGNRRILTTTVRIWLSQSYFVMGKRKTFFFFISDLAKVRSGVMVLKRDVRK